MHNGKDEEHQNNHGSFNGSFSSAFRDGVPHQS